MNKKRFTPETLHDFIVADSAKVLQKLERFAVAGAEKMYFLFDFDRTLTTSRHTGDDTTTWQILHGLLPEHGKKASNTIRNKYLAMESAGQLSREDSHDFSTSILNLHAAHGTHRSDIEQAAKQIKLRDGSQGLFAACASAGIPTVILSAGIRDIIELITHTHDINPTVLMSIKLKFDKAGRIVGWEKDSLVLTHSKHENFKEWAARSTIGRPFMILIGDTIEDARMVEGDDTVLRIRVCDLKNVEREDNYLEESFAAGYDMIIEENLGPVVTLTKKLINRAS